MRISNAASHTLTASISLTMLAGCAGGPQTGPVRLAQPGAGSPSTRGSAFQHNRLNSFLAMHGGIVPGHGATRPSFFSPDAKGKPLIFIADPQNNVVNIYLQARKNKMVGQITGLNAPTILTTDASRNLYVGEDGAPKEDVLVYAPPYTGTPKRVLDDTNYLPYGVSVSPHGVVAVANFCSLTPSGNQCNPNTGNVTFYANDSTKVCATVADPANVAYVTYDAFADDGSLFVTASLSLGSSFSWAVGEVKGGCRGKRITLVSKSNTIAYGPIKINKADQIAVIDENSYPEVLYTYDLPKQGSLGNPVSSATLVGAAGVTDFAFLASGTDLYTAEFSNSSVGSSSEYAYPAGGMEEKTFLVAGYPVDIAVTPPLAP